MRLYEELLAVHAHDHDADGNPRTLTASDVFEAVSLRTGIPSFLLRDDRALKLEEIVRTFGRWPRFDEIVCEHLLLYEDDPGRDRDEELLSARLE